jgi:hypothetical protein
MKAPRRTGRPRQPSEAWASKGAGSRPGYAAGLTRMVTVRMDRWRFAAGAPTARSNREDAGQGVTQPVHQSGLVGRQVDVEAVEDPQAGQQLVASDVEPVDLAAPGPGRVRDHIGVAPVGLGLAGIQVGGPAHHQPRHVGHRHVAGPLRRWPTGRSSRAGRLPGPPRRWRPGQSAPQDRLGRCGLSGRRAVRRHRRGRRRSALPCPRRVRPTPGPAQVQPLFSDR